MKTIIQKLLIVAACISVQAPLCAYSFTFINKTDQELRLTIEVGGIKDSRTLKPNKKKTFNFDRLDPNLCLDHIFVHARHAKQEQQINGPFGKVCENSSFVLTKDAKTNKIKAEKLTKQNGTSDNS